jgi:hypothetical protein
VGSAHVRRREERGRTDQDDGHEEMCDVSDLDCLADVAERKHVQSRESLIRLARATIRSAFVFGDRYRLTRQASR